VSSSVKDAIRRAMYEVEKRGVKKEYDVNDQVTSEIIEDMIVEAQDTWGKGNVNNLDDLILVHTKDNFLDILKGRIKKRHDDPPIYLFIKISTGWKIGPIDNCVSINRKNKGFDYLKYLLSRPGKSVSVVKLYQGFRGVSEEEDIANVGGVVNDPLIDYTAIRKYKKRISEIDNVLEEADENHLTVDEIDKHKSDRDQLISEISSSRYNSTQDDPNKGKIRNNVKSSITQALKIINKQSPVTYPYLKQGITLGYHPVYTPNPGFPIWK